MRDDARGTSFSHVKEAAWFAAARPDWQCFTSRLQDDAFPKHADAGAPPLHRFSDRKHRPPPALGREMPILRGEETGKKSRVGG